MSAVPHIQEVLPAQGRAETRGVVALASFIFVLWGGGVVVRRGSDSPPALASYQQSAFTALDAREQGLFNDLRAAADEIRALHTEAQGWPEPAILAAEAIPPFVADAVWKQRGRHGWARLDAHSPSHAVYWGKNDVEEWALVLSGESATVWRRQAKPDGAIPQAIPEMLILDDWQEFVPRHP